MQYNPIWYRNNHFKQFALLIRCIIVTNEIDQNDYNYIAENNIISVAIMYEHHSRHAHFLQSTLHAHIYLQYPAARKRFSVVFCRYVNAAYIEIRSKATGNT